MISRLSTPAIYRLLGLALVCAVLLSAGVGAVHLSPAEIMAIVLHHLGGEDVVNPVHEGLFFQIRLPRTVLCVLVGAALSVSGVLMQSLFRNPIVEPGLIGTSAGSALGSALLIVLGGSGYFSGLSFLGELLVPLCAFAGGLAATVVVYYFAASFRQVNIAIMILAGVAINAIANGGTGFLAYISRDPQARSITFWTLGTLSGASWQMVSMVGIATVSGILLSLGCARPLNALQLGEAEAGYLGVNTHRLKVRVLLLNTLLVSVATAMVGIIAFVGLIVPHLLRMARGSDNRFLIIGASLTGATLLTLTDVVCRVVIAPAEMPIGIVTAFLGAPIFLWQLKRMTRSREGGGFYA